MSRRAILLEGGWAHPPGDTARAVTRWLEPRGFGVDVVTDPAAVGPTTLRGCDLLVVSACWFGMHDERYTEIQRVEHAVPRDPSREEALGALRRDGCPLLALHTAVICFDGWREWRSWLGGTWDWATSWHPSPAEIHVQPDPGAPVSFAPFTVVDEEYQQLVIDPGVDIVARSAAGHPLSWVRESPHGRSGVDLLGHDRRSLDDPGHEALVGGLLDWLLEAE